MPKGFAIDKANHKPPVLEQRRYDKVVLATVIEHERFTLFHQNHTGKLVFFGFPIIRRQIVASLLRHIGMRHHEPVLVQKHPHVRILPFPDTGLQVLQVKVYRENAFLVVQALAQRNHLNIFGRSDMRGHKAHLSAGHKSFLIPGTPRRNVAYGRSPLTSTVEFILKYAEQVPNDIVFLSKVIFKFRNQQGFNLRMRRILLQKIFDGSARRIQHHFATVQKALDCSGILFVRGNKGLLRLFAKRFLIDRHYVEQ